MTPAQDPPSDAQLRTVLESVPVGILMTDMDGRIVLANGESERIFGYSRGELFGRPVETLVPAAERQAHARVRRTFTEHSGERAMGGQREFFGRRKDGALVPLEIGLTPTLGPEGSFVIASILDITVRRQLEAEKRELEDGIRRSQRLATLGELTGAVAHDFNNLLTVVVTALELGIDRCADALSADDPALEELRTAHESAQRAGALTRQLLTFSRRRVFSPVPVDLSELIERARPMLERGVGERAKLALSLADGLPSARVDPDLFEQVLLNLVLNAAEAIDGEGTIVVRTRAGDEDDPPKRVWIQISDDGAGMDPGTRARIFEPFFTTKEDGTGLGLAAAHGIVTQAGGEIDVESGPGEGTCFTIRLPVTGEAAERLAAPERRQPRTERPKGRGERILVVDDEEILRGVVLRALARVGYRTTEAGDGRAAIDICSVESGAIDLVVSDVELPDMDGVELGMRLRDIVPDVPILYTSGYSREEVTRKFALARPGAFLEKPFTVEALLGLVHRAVRGTLSESA